VAVGPDEKQRRQKPEPAAILEDRDGGGQQQKGDEVRTVEGERDGHAGRRAGRRQRAVKTAAAPPRHQAGEGAESRQQEGAQQHHAGKPGGAPDQIEQHLGQPFVGQVEMPRDGLAGIGLAGAGGGEGEGIGRWEPVILYDVLAGPEVPPEIGVVNLGREPAQP
jgi:hypothetical protein